VLQARWNLSGRARLVKPRAATGATGKKVDDARTDAQ